MHLETNKSNKLNRLPLQPVSAPGTQHWKTTFLRNQFDIFITSNAAPHLEDNSEIQLCYNFSHHPERVHQPVCRLFLLDKLNFLFTRSSEYSPRVTFLLRLLAYGFCCFFFIGVPSQTACFRYGLYPPTRTLVSPHIKIKNRRRAYFSVVGSDGCH